MLSFKKVIMDAKFKLIFKTMVLLTHFRKSLFKLAPFLLTTDIHFILSLFLLTSLFCSSEKPTQPTVTQWKFVAKFGSPEAMDEYRKAQRLYKYRMGDGIFYFCCAVKQCPYKMKAWPREDGENGELIYQKLNK